MLVLTGGEQRPFGSCGRTALHAPPLSSQRCRYPSVRTLSQLLIIRLRIERRSAVVSEAVLLRLPVKCLYWRAWITVCRWVFLPQRELLLWHVLHHVCAFPHWWPHHWSRQYKYLFLFDVSGFSVWLCSVVHQLQNHNWMPLKGNQELSLLWLVRSKSHQNIIRQHIIINPHLQMVSLQLKFSLDYLSLYMNEWNCTLRLTTASLFQLSGSDKLTTIC